MPDNTTTPPNKKTSRLGRGLGSLLGGGMDLDDKPNPPPPAQPVPPVQAASSHVQPATTVAVSAPPSSPPASSATTSQPRAAAQPVPSTPPPTSSAPVVPPASTQSTQAQGTQRVSSTANPQLSPQGSPQSSPQTTHTTRVVSNQPAPTTQPEPQRPIIPEESQIWMIPIDRLAPNTQQPRQVFTPEALRDLTASIKEKGILQPITARRLGEREFEIIAGERRWRAAQTAGLHEVPVILKKVTQEESLELAIIENIQRENLNAMEEAEAYEHLLRDYSLTQQQIADRLGKERSSVANSLRLLTLPGELKIMVRHNELSAGHAKVLLALDDSRTQIRIAKQVINERLSVRATEKLVAKAKTNARTGTLPNAKEVNVPRRLIDGLSTELQKLLGTKVAIDYADAKGRLSIHFYTDDQLSHIVEKIRRSWEK